MPLRLARVAEPPRSVRIAHDALKLVVGTQGISAGRHEFEHTREDLFIDTCIRQARAHFGQKIRLAKRAGAGAGHDMLCEHIEPAGSELLAIALALVDRLLRGDRFEELETIAGHKQSTTRLIEPVIGAADAL